MHGDGIPCPSSLQEPEGRPPCDWWGLNYYSRAVLDWTCAPASFPGEIMTEMFYPIHPEGLYKAIVQSSQYGIPIYITETGIADQHDQNRHTMIRLYMDQVGFREMEPSVHAVNFVTQPTNQSATHHDDHADNNSPC